jgi:hypothetical protein
MAFAHGGKSPSSWISIRYVLLITASPAKIMNDYSLLPASHRLVANGD